MPLDYNSLLMAIGFAGAGLAVTMFGSWLSARADGFLLTWSIGIALVVAHVFTYSAYVEQPALGLLLIAFALLLIGFSILFGAAQQFRFGKVPWRVVAVLAGASILAFAPAAVLGLDGLALMIANAAAAILLLTTAYQHWQGRGEAPGPILGITGLYAATGLSFAVCAIVLATAGQLVLGRAPDNWAEDLNLIVSIAGITGIGALSLALNQSRLARTHRLDSLTDALTGLMNRRALFSRIGTAPLDRFTGVLLFDLDHFKSINDRFGHFAGDRVLRQFALVMSDNLRRNEIAARLGGEEFAAVLLRTTTDQAHQIAERVRKVFSETVIDTDRGNLQCTVSVGIAFPTSDDHTFEDVLSEADKALYRAKNAGRNRVASASLRLAG